MPLRHINIDALTEAHLFALIENKRLERKTIEYKEALHDLSCDNEVIKFLAHVSSLANTDGGDIVFGIKEDQGVPVELTGARTHDYKDFVRLEAIDNLKNRMEALLSSGVSPRMTVAIHEIKLANGNITLVVRVPRSFAMPHMIVYNQESRFWNRTNTGKQRMDVNELRASFSLVSHIEDRAKGFRAQRMAIVQQGGGPYRLQNGAFYILHIIPFGFLDPGARIPITEAAELHRAFPPLAGDADIERLNLDGFACASTIDKPGRAYQYVQLFRSGALEAAGNIWREDVPDMVYVSGIVKSAFERLPLWLRSLQERGREGPYFLMLTLVGVRGRAIAPSDGNVWPGHQERRRFDRDIVEVPDVVIEGLNSDLHPVLREVFDIIWQACDHKKCPLIDEMGNLKSNGGNHSRRVT